MSALAHGSSSFEVVVTLRSAYGAWLGSRSKAFLMPYTAFPGFENQPAKSLLSVAGQFPVHFLWPDIDINLTAQSIEHPARLPLTAKSV